MTVTVQGTSSLYSTETLSSFDVPVPAGSQAGDLLVIEALVAANRRAVPPADGTWTSGTLFGGSSVSNEQKAQHHRKELTGPAAATYAFSIVSSTTGSSGSTAKPVFHAYLLRPSGPGAWSVVEDGAYTGSAPFNAPAITMPSDGVVLVAASQGAATVGDTITSPASPFIEAFRNTATATSDRPSTGGYQNVASSGSVGPWTFSPTTVRPTTLHSIGIGFAAAVTVDLAASLEDSESLGSGLRVTESLAAGAESTFSFTADLSVLDSLLLEPTMSDSEELSAGLELTLGLRYADVFEEEELTADLGVSASLSTWDRDEYDQFQEDMQLEVEIEIATAAVPPLNARMIWRHSENYPDPTLTNGRPV